MVKYLWKFLLWLSGLRNRVVVSMRMWVRSLALLSGLRLRRCRELWCRLQTRLGLGPALLWLWCRSVATVPIRPLAWEPPCVVGAALEKAKTNKQTKKKKPKKTKPKTQKKQKELLSPSTSSPIIESPIFHPSPVCVLAQD